MNWDMWKSVALIYFGTAWVMGFVLAKGLWSTLLCFVPLWAWYLTCEFWMNYFQLLKI
jgi:hypothetical protein